MSDAHLTLLLQLVNAEGDVNRLLKRGLEFSQIAQMISDAISQGMIFEEGETLRLTEAGLHRMRLDESEGKRRTDGGWISPFDEFRTEQLSPDDIYLPDSYIAFSELRRDD